MNEDLARSGLHLEPHIMRVLSWNLNTLPRIAGFAAKNPMGRIKSAARFIGDHFAICDICAFQELFDPRARSYMENFMQELGFKDITPNVCKSEFGSGLALFVKGELNVFRRGFVPFGRFNSAMEDIFVRKGFLWAKLQKGDLPFYFFATHMQPYGNAWAKLVRKMQVRKLAKFTQGIKSPIVFAGDFNIDRLGKLFGVGEYMNLIKALSVTVPYVNKQEYYHADHSSTAHPNKNKKSKGTHPDHVLARGVKRVDAHIIDYRKFSEEFITDHLPVVAHIYFKNF